MSEKRTIAIGDIHGGLKALEQAMERAYITSKDTLVFMGDLVDGWSESAKLIDFLITLNEKNNCIFIRGNHDTWCEEWLDTDKINITWFKHGGKLTIDSYKEYSKEKKRVHLKIFNSMVDYHIDEQNNLFIHAGFTSMNGPQNEHDKTNFSWDRTLWETAIATDKTLNKSSSLYPQRFKLFNEIFIGHTPTIHYNFDTPYNALNLWNVDTGAAFTGKLSLLNVNTKEFWQSDEVRTLYPNEKGRNKT